MQVYEYPEDVWKIIKEFAGIYQIGTEWSNVRKLPLSTVYMIYPFLRVGLIVFLNDLSVNGIRILIKYKTEKAWKHLYKLATCIHLLNGRIGTRKQCEFYGCTGCT